jgi:hypothetical protein
MGATVTLVYRPNPAHSPGGISSPDYLTRRTGASGLNEFVRIPIIKGLFLDKIQPGDYILQMWVKDKRANKQSNIACAVVGVPGIRKLAFLLIVGAEAEGRNGIKSAKGF